MTNTIRQQKELMAMALHHLDEINTIERLIDPIDPIICKVMVKELQEKYITVTSALLHNFLTVSNEL